MISGASEEELELANVIADKLLLQKENQELKKQYSKLKIKYLHETDVLQRQLSSNSLQLKTQQKKFIKYLEDEIKSCEAVSDLLFNSNKEMKVYKQILQKYKEIIGDDKE